MRYIIAIIAVISVSTSGLCIDYDPCAGYLCVPVEYPTIQSAIDAAEDGDVVLIADGTYKGDGNRDLNFLGKAITVMSAIGPEMTIIDCENDGRGFYFTSREGSDSMVRGFTIENGYTTGDGGGFYCYDSKPTIMNCTITGNTASTGGGIYCSDSYPTISNCVIEENTAESYGGGISCNDSSPTITNCIITGNDVTGFYGHGGGIYCYDSYPTVMYCSITENRTGRNGYGGGFYFKFSSPTITNCTISGNTAYDSGGIECLYSSPTITNCTITRNAASNNGGGIYCYYYSAPTITNCILWNDIPNEIQNLHEGNPTVKYTDIEGGYSGTGNIDKNPRFIPYPLYGYNYLLQPDSPCIDTGDPSIEDRLYDWHWRWPDFYPDGARSDMGAYGGPGNIGWIWWIE